MKKFYNTINNNLLFILLTLQPFLDILAYFQKESAVSIAGYFRLALTFLVPLYVLIFTKNRKKFILSMSVIVVFCLLHVLNGFRVGYISLFTDAKYMLLVSHSIILTFSFMFLYEKKELLRQIVNSLKIIIPSVAITYYLSYFLNSGNHTYIDSYIGWTGWNNTPSVFSIILSALFPFSVYFCIKSTKKWLIVFLLPLSYMYIMNATKATYLTLIGTLLCCAGFLTFEFFVQRKEKFPTFVVITMVVLLVASVALYTYSPRFNIDTLNNISLEQGEEMLSNGNNNASSSPETSSNNDASSSNSDATSSNNDSSSNNNKNPVADEETFALYLDKAMVERFGEDRIIEAYDGDLTAKNLANNRLRKIIFGSLVWEDTDILTKFVGFEQTLMYIGEDTYDLESDPQAIFFYYGYIGSVLFGGLLLYFMARLIKQLVCHFKESCTFFNFTIFLTYGLLLVSTVYTGHLLRRPNSAIYLTIILLLIYCQTESLFAKKVEQN